MTQKDFWRNSKVAVIGGGSWGTALASLASKNALEVRVFVRKEEQAKQINSTRTSKYLPELVLNERVHAYSDLARVFDGGVQAVIWALPSDVCRAEAKRLAHLFRGDEVILHATKGIEQGSLKRISEVLREELPCPRIGVISGPNLATEIGRGEPAATVIASAFGEVIDAGGAILGSETFRVYPGHDVIGAEWAGTLKNILAIASGALDAMKLGWNARAMLITRGLAEMVRFGVAMGADQATFLGLAGVGDVLATCGSPLSRNYRVGFRLAQGESLSHVIESLGSVAEGVRSARTVYAFASSRGIQMPITEGVYHFVEGKSSAQDTLKQLMTRPAVHDTY